MIKVFKDADFKKRIIHFMIPFLIQELILAFTALIGTLMIEPISAIPEYNIGGALAITGMTSAYQVFFIFNISTMALSFIGNLFISQHYGRGHLDQIEFDTYLLLKASLIISIIFTIICAVIPEQIMSIFVLGVDESTKADVIKYGAEYLRIFSASFVFTGITIIYYCVMRNVKMEKNVVFNSAYCLVLNILLNAIFVYGLRMGVKGVALSLVLARVIECISAIVIENVKGYIHFHWKDFIKLNKPLIKEYSHYIFLIFFSKLLWVLGTVAISIVVGMVGNKELIYANSLMTQIKSIVITVSSSAASAVCILVGRELGANRLTKAKEHGQDTMRFALIIGIIEIVVFMITLPIMYLMNIETFKSVSGDFDGAKSFQFLWIIYLIYATQLIPQAYNSIVCNGLFNAGGDIKIVAVFDSFTSWILFIPAIVMITVIPDFVAQAPLIVFCVVIVEELVKCPFFIKHYTKRKWIKNITGREGFVFN